jgi:elongator complex protein 3
LDAIQGKKMPTVNIQILKTLLKQHPRTKDELSNVKRQLARDFGVGILTNNWLLKIYRQSLENHQIKQAVWLEQLLVKRRVRTLSGVAPVAVATKPYPCPGRCIYCPSDSRMPKSYLTTQPAAARALRFKFSPYAQVQGRLKTFYDNGHQPEKVDMRILGGTWSAYPRQYQSWFVKELYRGLNEFNINSKLKTQNSKPQLKTQNLKELQKINENTQHRCVGLSIETRPDYITLEEIKTLRRFGVTKVELGVQHLNEKVLSIVKRGHKKEDVVRATKLLKDAGFKVCYHIMPNLPGSNPEMDLAVVKELFNNPDFKPDQLKIYPCTVLKNSELYQWYKQGRYQTYDDKTLINLLVKIKQIVPRYVRIERIYRDVPSSEIVSGCSHINIREMVQEKMKEEEIECRCIRCREVRDNLKTQNSKLKTTTKNLKLFIYKYKASDGIEYFVSFESFDREFLYAFIRLRLVSDEVKNQLPILRHTAIIRDLHTYGKLVPITTAYQLQPTTYAQHHGLGKKLLAKAEGIAKSSGCDKIAVISGVGVREYYRKLGYELEDRWEYMVKRF